MWEKFGVNSLPVYGDYDESCMFACAAGRVIESLYRYLKLEDRKVIAHMNEWMLGMAVLYLFAPACFLNFLNQKEYRTKIIFVPSYLNGNDGIFNVPYYDLLIGLDLTVFPSYYEPWGYTPLESIAFGVPTVTTDLAGFGLWAKETGISGNRLTEGVEVIHRTDGNYSEVAENIKNSIINYSELSGEEISKTKASAQTLSKKASWRHFIKHYYKAYGKALNYK